jgi:hypothetical protein
VIVGSTSDCANMPNANTIDARFVSRTCRRAVVRTSTSGYRVRACLARRAHHRFPRLGLRHRADDDLAVLCRLAQRGVVQA